MDITKIDRNFATSFEAPEDLEWYSVREAPFVTYGVFFAEEEGIYRRVPKEVSDTVNEGVKFLATQTAGGRVRFATDSPYVALRATEPFDVPFGHMPLAGKSGFTLFGDGHYVGTYIPGVELVMNSRQSGSFTFDGLRYKGDAMSEMTLYFPLYNAVKEVYIGLRRGSRLEAPKPYRHEKPILFYGSSVTQGGCASKSSDDYINRLSTWLDADILNLGFSGSARGEQSIADYIAAQDVSVFVMDYDYNAPDAAHLQRTHYPLYKTIRTANPTTPIVFLTMPTFSGCTQPARFAVIEETYRRAKEEGDENVYFVSGDGSVGKYATDGEWGLVDGCHPDSLGFYLMAKNLYPTLDAILNK